MKCKWQEIEEPDERGWRRVRCVRCGLTTGKTPHTFDKINSQCAIPGWGDWVAHWIITWLGIDKGAIAQKLGLTRVGCGCEQRQEIINEAGWQVQVLLGWAKEKAGSFFRKREPPSA